MSSQLGDISRPPGAFLWIGTAPPIEDEIGGSQRERLCLLEPPFNISEWSIATANRSCLSNPSDIVSFTIWDGKNHSVDLSRNSLQGRLRVRPPLVDRMARDDDLKGLFQAAYFRRDLQAAQDFARTSGKDLHFPRKDYPYPTCAYVTPDFIAMGSRETLGKGGFAKVKKATIRGQPCARRIIQITAENKGMTEKTLALYEKIRDKPGLLDLKGICRYTTPKGQEKVVTFHKYYEFNLLKFFNSTNWTKRLGLELSAQLFNALLSLDGAHGDLKPENILINKKNELALCDFDFFRAKGVKTSHNAGSPGWASPESFIDIPAVTEKLDVWPAALLILYLIGKPKIPWHREKHSPTEIHFLIRNTNKQGLLADQGLTDAETTLLSNMLVIGLYDRWTIDQCADYFKRFIFNPDIEKDRPDDDYKS